MFSTKPQMCAYGEAIYHQVKIVDKKLSSGKSERWIEVAGDGGSYYIISTPVILSISSNPGLWSHK